jgi:hypothetical protein
MLMQKNVSTFDIDEHLGTMAGSSRDEVYRFVDGPT